MFSFYFHSCVFYLIFIRTESNLCLLSLSPCLWDLNDMTLTEEDTSSKLDVDDVDRDLWLCRRTRLSLEELNERFAFHTCSQRLHISLYLLQSWADRLRIMFFKRMCYDFSTVAINAVERSILSQGSPILKSGPCMLAFDPNRPPPHTPSIKQALFLPFWWTPWH